MDTLQPIRIEYSPSPWYKSLLMKGSDLCLHILFGLDKVEIAVIQNETEVRGHYTNLLTDKNPKLVSLDYL